MKLITFVLLFFSLNIPSFVLSQNFGCYDSKSLNINKPKTAFYSDMYLYNIEWEDFALDSNIKDGYFIKYIYPKEYCSPLKKMEGLVKNGVQEGVWKLYLTQNRFYCGVFKNGKKQGLWIEFYIDKQGDTTSIAEVTFKNDLYDGIANYFYPNGEIYKSIGYQNGLINGQEITYSYSNTNEKYYIEKFKEYSNGKLHGKFLIYSYDNPNDTTIYGEYLFGKKNGRFIYHNFGKKIIVDYINDKVDGKFIRFYDNGVLACEFDFKNNLPYNTIQINDTSSNKISSNTLIKGNGILNYYYDNGVLASSFEYNNQFISGKFSRYYKNGAIMEEGVLYTSLANNFVKNIPIEHCEDLNQFSVWQVNFSKGTNYRVFNEDGSLRSKIQSVFNDSIGEYIIVCENYVNNKLINKNSYWQGLLFGHVNQFFENGNLKMSGNYLITDKDSIKVSVKNGIFKYFHSNGNIKAIINYSYDYETGTSYFYDESGKLKRVKVIENNGSIYNIYDNDTVNVIDEKGRKQGKWINIAQSYLENNCYYKPYQIKYYKDDKPTGIWEYFDSYGEWLVEKIIWQDSINSYCKKYFFGKIIEEGYMINEIQNGEWRVYDYKKGYLKYKGSYNCGVKEGVWQEFKKNGKLLKEVEYVDGQILNSP
ncbi:MAG: hypothetical protein Kow0079_15910 [Vicingaceae bacterium]